MSSDKISKAYKQSKDIYDTTLTQDAWWSRLYIKLFWDGVSDLDIAAKVLSAVPEDFAGRLLDVPVGTGVFTLSTYKRLPKADITCLDYSEDMLCRARARYAESGLTQVHCVQGDVGQLPFDDEAFDIVLSMNGFHAFPDKPRAYRETHRVLKKGGLFCGCFYVKGESKRSDFIVSRFLAPKGWFTPPFETAAEVKRTLEGLYGEVETDCAGAMLSFRCIK